VAKAKGDEEKIIPIHAVRMRLVDGSLVETIANAGTPKFLAYNPKTGKTKTYASIRPEHVSQIEVDIPITDNPVIIVPPDPEAVKEGAVLLPDGIEDYGSTEQLIEEIRQHIHRYVDMPKENETFAAWYVLLSWIHDRLNTLCYYRFLGDTGTGKSRGLDVVGRLCYNACMASGAITPAPIYRMIRAWRGTIVLDEADRRKSDETDEVITILNCGFEKGRPVIRCSKDNPDRLQILPTYGPKVIATRQTFDDKALESKCLTTKMTETDREDIPAVLPQSFYEDEARLRRKLLKWRLDNLDKINPEQVQTVDLSGIEPRIRQAAGSFAVLFAQDEALKQRFKEFLQKYNQEIVLERSETYEGAVVRAIVSLIEQGHMEFTPQQIASEMADNGFMVRGKPPTGRSVGRRLKALGLETRVVWKEGKAQRVISVEEYQVLLKRLIRRYVPLDLISESLQNKLTSLRLLHYIRYSGTPDLLKKEELERESGEEKGYTPIDRKERKDVSGSEGAKEEAEIEVFTQIPGVSMRDLAEMCLLFQVPRPPREVYEKLSNRFNAHQLTAMFEWLKEANYVYQPRVGIYMWDKGRGLPGGLDEDEVSNGGDK